MKNLVLQSKGDYTLIARTKEDFTVHEYVVAWCYNKETDSWCQGHYFSDLSEAVFHMENKKMSKEEKRIKMLRLMHEYIKQEVEDENAYDYWTAIVPDEPDMEDFKDMADITIDWLITVNTFMKCLKRYEA